jgi:hypothetical protein
MAQIGDGVNYVGDGNNGTTTGTSYSGVLVRLNAPSGWGPADINVDVGGTPTLILGVFRDGLLDADMGSGVQPNGTWRQIV